MSILNWQVNSSSVFASLSSVMKDNSSVLFFSSNIIYFGHNHPIEMQIFRLSSASENSSNFLYQFWNDKSNPLQIFHHFSVSLHTTALSYFSSCISILDKRIPSKSQFWHLFQVFWRKFAKFFMLFFKPQVSFSSNFAWYFSVMRDNSPVLFRSNFIYFAQKGPTKVKIIETFECLDQNSLNSCHFWNNKSVFNRSLFLMIWHQL